MNETSIRSRSVNLKLAASVLTGLAMAFVAMEYLFTPYVWHLIDLFLGDARYTFSALRNGLASSIVIFSFAIAIGTGANLVGPFSKRSSAVIGLILMVSTLIPFAMTTDTTALNLTILLLVTALVFLMGYIIGHKLAGMISKRNSTVAIVLWFLLITSTIGFITYAEIISPTVQAEGRIRSY